MAHKHTRVLSRDKVENKLFKASVFWMNDSQIHRNTEIARDDSTAKLSCNDWCDFPLNTSERISEQALFFTRRAADVASEACFTVMTGDRHDGRAAMDFSMIIFAQKPSWLVWISTVMPVWLYFSSFLFFSLFCFWTPNFIYYTSVSCVWFLLPYVSLQSNWAWKSLKLGMPILFFLWGFSYLLTF